MVNKFLIDNYKSKKQNRENYFILKEMQMVSCRHKGKYN